MKIGDVSRAVEVSAHTIRYYEKQNLLPRPAVDASGHRAYSKNDVELLNWIVCLKKSGMSLANIRAYTRAHQQRDTATQCAMLNLHAQKLREQQEAIGHYLEVTERKLQRLKPLT